VTWIRSPEETGVPIGFDSHRVRTYVRETPFDEQIDPGPPYVLRADPGVSPHAEVGQVSYRSAETDRSEH